MKLHKIAFSILTLAITSSSAYAVQITDINQWNKCRNKAEKSADDKNYGMTSLDLAIKEQCGKPPAIETVSVSGTVGMHPYDVVRTKMWKAKFMAISKKQYPDLVESLTVASPTYLDGDWIVGSGHIPHFASSGAAIGINIKTKKVVAMMWSDGQQAQIFGVNPNEDMPLELYSQLNSLEIPLPTIYRKPNEIKLIEQAVKNYALKRDHMIVRVDVVRISGNYAKAAVIPPEANMDGALALLKKHNKKWVVVDMGTDAGFYDVCREFGMPDSICAHYD